MIRIGILGGAGYTAGELIRLLLHHPEAQLVFVNSESNAGNLLTDVHEGLYGDTDMRFTSEMPFDAVDVVFFCFGHGKSEAFLREHHIPATVKIIDLAQDFRLAASKPYDPTQPYTPDNHDFVYGLPEINRQRIAAARHVANPGCFATCIQLGLLPAAHMQLIDNDVMVNAITGSTGAGVKPGATTHFSWRTDNLSVYKAFRHQHVPEIRQSRPRSPRPSISYLTVAILRVASSPPRCSAPRPRPTPSWKATRRSTPMSRLPITSTSRST